MTKVQVEYEFDQPLAEGLLDRVAAAHRIFGMSRVRLNPELDRLEVDYDASRLTLAQVEAALRGLDLPIRKAGGR
ncbi:MAG: hypothetical protein IT160_06700 [Bryobacterales bacterium]|nr:hypothetical protein [Bryobacterales bacterium]